MTDNTDKLSGDKSLHVPKDILKKIKDWLELDKLIFIKNCEMKQLKKDKTNIEVDILKFMDSSKIHTFQHENGYSIKLNIAESKSTINESIVKDVLVNSNMDEETINNIVNLINSKRKINEKKTLKKNKL